MTELRIFKCDICQTRVEVPTEPAHWHILACEHQETHYEPHRSDLTFQYRRLLICDECYDNVHKTIQLGQVMATRSEIRLAKEKRK